MAKSVKREKTKYKNIYFNTSTKKYDVKYNYKEYDVKSCKNVYKSKWIYNIQTITEAKAELARLQTQGVKTDTKDLSLQGAYEAWKIKALAQNFSPVTIENTSNFMTIIYKFVPAETLLKNIDEDVYYKFCADIRTAGYSEETLFSLNATFRKIINHSFKKRLISENILSYTDNLKTKQKTDYRVIDKDEFDLLDNYFKKKNKIYRFLINLLYYTGLRIGEALAITYQDFEEFSYYKKSDEKPLLIAPRSEAAEEKHLQGWRIKIDKSYISRMKIEKETKNYKNRTIPLAPARLFLRLQNEHIRASGSMDDKVFNIPYQTIYSALERACKALEIPPISCHDFRHTFATMSLENGMDVKTLSAIIGHVSSATTLNIYTHITDEMQRNAARNIDQGIAGAEVEEEPEREEAALPVTFTPYRPPHRRPGTGCISQINDRLFEGRYSPKWIDGKKHARNIYAHTREECEEKLAALIVQMKRELAELKAAQAAEAPSRH